MATRRDPREGQERPEQGEKAQDGSVVEFPKSGVTTGIRPEVMAIFEQILEEDRSLFERLAAYDRGEDR